MRWEAPPIMRIGIRLAFSGLVLASIIVSAIGVHILWWRTAEANSHALADTINSQIVSTVEKELTTITTEARAAHTAIRTLFVQHVLETREADKREFVFLSQLQSHQNISLLAFAWADAAFFAVHKLGDLASAYETTARLIFWDVITAAGPRRFRMQTRSVCSDSTMHCCGSRMARCTKPSALTTATRRLRAK